MHISFLEMSIGDGERTLTNSFPHHPAKILKTECINQKWSTYKSVKGMKPQQNNDFLGV